MTKYKKRKRTLSDRHSKEDGVGRGVEELSAEWRTPSLSRASCLCLSLSGECP